MIDSGELLIVSPEQAFCDLEWVVKSPSLVPSNIANLTEQIWDHRLLSQIAPKELAAYLNRHMSHRVGDYFEHLIAYWLSSQEQIHSIQHRLPVRDGSRTLGELDFLFRDQSDQLNHWEVAVKFYLYHPEIQIDSSHLIGPNAQDTFERKISRLFDHQLQMSKFLSSEPVQKSAIIKGMIFYHANQRDARPECLRLSEDHLRGSWGYRHEIPDLISSDSDHFATNMTKPYWLSSLVDPRIVMNRQEMINSLEEHFSQSQRPVLLSILKKEESGFEETSRLFVVSSSWPDVDSM